MTGWLTPKGKPVVAVLETTPCIVGIIDIGADGEPEYDGNDSSMRWDAQRPETRGGKRIFLDDEGAEWTFDQLTKAE